MSAADKIKPIVNYGMAIDLLWHERVIKTYAITKPGTIRVGGSQECEVYVEYLHKDFETVLAIIDRFGEIFVCKKNMELPNGLSLHCRPLDVARTPKVGQIGFSQNETITIGLSILITLLMWFMMFSQKQLNISNDTEEAIQKKENYKAKIIFEPKQEISQITEAPVFQNDITQTLKEQVRLHSQQLQAQKNKVRQNQHTLSTSDVQKMVAMLGSAANSKGNSDLLDSAQQMDGAKTFGGGQSENWARDFSKGIGRGNQQTANLGDGGVGTVSKGQFPGGDGSTGKTTGLGRQAVQVPIAGVEDMGVSGHMDRDAIRAVIMQNRQVIRSCYERYLSRDADLYGRILLKWNIIEGGRVMNAKALENTMGHPGVEKCLIGQLKTWNFPEPPADQIGEVVFPFVFSSQ